MYRHYDFPDTAVGVYFTTATHGTYARRTVDCAWSDDNYSNRIVLMSNVRLENTTSSLSYQYRTCVYNNNNHNNNWPTWHILSEDEWGDLEFSYKACQAAITDAGVLRYMQLIDCSYCTNRQCRTEQLVLLSTNGLFASRRLLTTAIEAANS